MDVITHQRKHVSLFAIISWFMSIFSTVHGFHNVKLQHSFDGGVTWYDRSVIELAADMGGLTSSSGQFRDSFPLSRDMKQQLLNLAKRDDLYYYRLVAGSDENDLYVSGVAPACELILTQLSDIVQISVDPVQSRFHSVSVFPLRSALPATPLSPLSIRLLDEQRSTQTPSTGSCAQLIDARELDSMSDYFNSTLRFIDPIEGPVPDTQTYLSRLEREQKEKEQGVGQDNRSFLAKYWMYIVPVLIFLLLSAGSNPEQAAAQ